MTSHEYKPQNRSSSCTTKILTLCIILILVAAAAVSIVYLVIKARRPTIGINYGRVANNLPPPAQVVEIMKRLKIGQVKIYDSDPQVLGALANSGLQVSIMVTNEEVQGVGSSQVASDQWVQKNVVAWYKSVKIIIVVVGNEVLSNSGNQGLWNKLVPAMENIQTSLLKVNLGRIMVTTAIAIDCLQSSFPPSSGTFREDIASSVMQPMLEFLSQTNAYFFVNVYPYFAWAGNSDRIPLDYAVFGSSKTVVEDGSFQYSDLLDAQLDALVCAMSKLGYYNVSLAISETGWPSYGDSEQPGANISVAADYNRRFVRKSLWGAKGTPRRPGKYIPAYIFSLFNEDLKPGPTTERNWGLLYPNGSTVYDIDLTGRRKDSQYSSTSTPFQVTLPAGGSSTFLSPGNESSPSHLGSGQQSGQQSQEGDGLWCVAKQTTEIADLHQSLDFACSKSNCTAIQFGKTCYEPDSLLSHASYAFNMYYQEEKTFGGTCSFNGVAALTNINPSYGECTYPLN